VLNTLSDLLKNQAIFQCIFMLFFGSVVMAQSCLDGSYFFSTQDELNKFKTQNPNCTHIKGSIVIENQIKNLSPFSKIKTIGGNLQFRNCNELTDLSGLENLETIGGDLFLNKNNLIKNFKALKNIQSIGGLKVEVNPALINFEGLEKITSMEKNVFISGNENLQNFNGLENLKSITGNLNIRYSPDLVNLNGLNNLQKVASLEVAHNDAIGNLEGLEQLKAVSGSFSLNYNKNLKNVCGLNSLELVEVNFSMLNNASLENVDGLISLQKVGKYLWVESNKKLTSIQGFENINHFPIWKLILKGNTALNICNNILVCNVIKDRINNDIESNGSNCSSTERVKQACDSQVITTEPAEAIIYINNKTLTGTKTFESNFEIESNSFVFFSSQVTFKATNAITLKSGFEVKQSANFSAEIGEVFVGPGENINNCN